MKRSTRVGGSLRDPHARTLVGVFLDRSTAADPGTAPTGGCASRGRDEADALEALLRLAAQGLESRDRLLYELTRAGALSGGELAAAVDVPVGQIYTVLSRMRRRAWWAVTSCALVSPDAGSCQTLHDLFDPGVAFSPLVRKRVTRHLGRCPTCRDLAGDRMVELGVPSELGLRIPHRNPEPAAAAMRT